MLEMDKNGAWQTYKDDWMERPSLKPSILLETRNSYTSDVWSMWSKDFIQRISNSKRVESVIALGSVLAISLHDIQAGTVLTLSSSNVFFDILSSYQSWCYFVGLTEFRLQFVSREWASKGSSRRVDRLQGPLSGPRECVLSDG